MSSAGPNLMSWLQSSAPIEPPAETSALLQLDPDPVAPPPPPLTRVKPLAPERFALQVTIGQATHEKLERAQALLRHRHDWRRAGRYNRRRPPVLVRETIRGDGAGLRSGDNSEVVYYLAVCLRRLAFCVRLDCRYVQC